MFNWLKSVRAVSVILIIIAVIAGFMLGKLSETNFLQIATVIVGAYFVKRDEYKDK